MMKKRAIEGYTRYLLEHVTPGDDVATTRFTQGIYGYSATRSPFLTVILAILNPWMLTWGALAAASWFQNVGKKHRAEFAVFLEMTVSAVGPIMYLGRQAG